MVKKPVIRVQDINPMLFSFVEELNDVKVRFCEICIRNQVFKMKCFVAGNFIPVSLANIFISVSPRN